MARQDVQAAVTAYWSARAPLFDGVASHVAQRDLWRGVLEAAFQAEGPKDVVDLGTGTGRLRSFCRLARPSRSRL